VYPTTERISTYLYAFVAGPYSQFNNEVPDHDKHVPMRIFARKSIAQYVDHQEFFKITMAGMDYYKDFFGLAYPFRKYDQVYVPEFNAGAMENVGLVTYNEAYVPRSKTVPTVKKEGLAITILHELAHMWFGNLVTMKWWDDLWLNESFATFMSHISLANAKGLEKYTMSWELMIRYKSWGMKTDQFSTTHPIAADCKHTEDADVIFDGISYGKGASFLKQMCHYITEDVLKAGMIQYF
jgi:aminopeptidase N